MSLLLNKFFFVGIYKLTCLAIRHRAVNNMSKDKNTLAYLTGASVTKKKMFYGIDPGVNGIKQFLFV